MRWAPRLGNCEFALDDMVSFVLFWGGVNGVFGNWLPAVVAAIGLLRTDQFDTGVLPWRADGAAQNPR